MPQSRCSNSRHRTPRGLLTSVIRLSATGDGLAQSVLSKGPLVATQKGVLLKMRSREIAVSLIPAETDPPLRSPEYQQGLGKLARALGAHGMKVSSVVELEESFPTGSETVYSGTFTVELAKAVAPWLAGFGLAITGWLTARNGRKVRLKIDDIELEARTPEDVGKLIPHVEKLRQLKK